MNYVSILAKIFIYIFVLNFILETLLCLYVLRLNHCQIFLWRSTRQNYVPWKERCHIDFSTWYPMKHQGKTPTTLMRASSNDVLRTLKYHIFRMLQCNVLRTSSYCPIYNAKGRRLPTSWGPVLQKLWGRPHMV